MKYKKVLCIQKKLLNLFDSASDLGHPAVGGENLVPLILAKQHFLLTYFY
jgi:hypothetical protein